MRTEQLRRLLQCPRCKVHNILANGDCFYEALRKADVVDGASVQDLRTYVAEQYDSDRFADVKMYASILPGMFDWVLDCDTLEKMQQKLINEKTAWADDFAIQILSSRYKLMILIVDEGARSSSSKFICIKPEPTLRSSVLLKEGVDIFHATTTHETTSSTPDTNRMSEDSVSCSRNHIVLLNRTRREHYNLIGIGDRVSFSDIYDDEDIPLETRALWGFRKRHRHDSTTDSGKNT